MKKNRLEIVLHRNQRIIRFDLLLAALFVLAATATGIAMKTAVGQLIG